ncbi:hypothetical protein D3H55_02235 [Bacillus salacetis]|uniref:Uncharacterized protein n=1 Tax=Bacillus salacetis TaxID=2315464 RepID=A0A3A1R7C4_9BACI|nr:hypothetical protein D3H55_02235 [Bacillus salacetis]
MDQGEPRKNRSPAQLRAKWAKENLGITSNWPKQGGIWPKETQGKGSLFWSELRHYIRKEKERHTKKPS